MPKPLWKQIPGDLEMVIIWWFWSLLAICASDSFRDQAVAIMRTTPVIDGHNDLPWQLLNLFNNQLLRPDADLNKLAQTHTNIPKLKAGFVGGQFWSAYMPCDTQNKDAVKRILEQMDVIHRMCQLYPETFMCVTNSSDILQAFRRGKVASLIGVEGGHLIDSSLGVLRTLYHLGMRYLTLTHNCNTPWADNWLVDRGDDEAESQGLSPFGKRLLNEMNRLGVMIDLSHVSVATMKDALQISRAPVIFSHSSAYSLCPHRRNVPDDVLQLVKNTSSLVMVNFFSNFVSCSDSATLPQVAGQHCEGRHAHSDEPSPAPHPYYCSTNPAPSRTQGTHKLSRDCSYSQHLTFDFRKPCGGPWLDCTLVPTSRATIPAPTYNINL